jgi:hypothetical protein
MMNVYELPDEQYYAASSEQEALAAYADDFKPDPSDAPPTARLLSDAELDLFKMAETDEDDTPTGTHITFRAYLAEMTDDRADEPAFFFCGEE